MNTVQIAGNLCSDPEERITKTGLKVTTLSIADNLNKEDVIFWRVSVFGDVSAKVISYLKKGSAVIVDGSMQAPRPYQKKDGTQGIGMSLTACNVRFSPFKAKDSNNEQPQNQPQQQDKGYRSNENVQQGNQQAYNQNPQNSQGNNEGQANSGYQQENLPF